MEKIRISYKKDLKIFLYSYVILFAISAIFFKTNIQTLFLVGLNLTLIFLMISILNYVSFSFIYFSNKGLIFQNPFYERIIPWEELSIETKTKKKDQIKIVLTSYDFKRKITIDYVIIDSLLELAKKYCPEGHELHITIEEFSKTKNDSFLNRL